MQERKKEMHLAAGCGPEVDAGAEADGEHVLGGPVDEVQVEVVLQGRRVQHLHAGDEHKPVSSRSENSVHERCLWKGEGGSNLVGCLGDLAGRLLGGGGAGAAGAVQLLGEGGEGCGGAVRLEAEEVVGACPATTWRVESSCPATAASI